MGDYVAIVVGIGTALKIFGVTSWIGFLIDVVLAAILAGSLPVVLRREIGKYLGTNEWKLLDSLVVPDNPNGRPTAVLFDSGTDSLLISYDRPG